MNAEPFKFDKFDRKRLIVGAIGNQIRVLVQRMKMRGYKPWKILLNRGLRDALRLDARDSGDYVLHDLGDRFLDLPIKVDETVSEPIIMIKPELRTTPLDTDTKSTDERRVWKRRFHAVG